MTGSQVTEKTIEDRLRTKCKSIGAFCLKNTGMNGIPDRLVIYKGLHIFVELKRPGGKPRPLQIAVMEKLRKAGSIAIIIDTQAKVDSFIEDLQNGRREWKEENT